VSDARLFYSEFPDVVLNLLAHQYFLKIFQGVIFEGNLLGLEKLLKICAKL